MVVSETYKQIQTSMMLDKEQFKKKMLIDSLESFLSARPKHPHNHTLSTFNMQFKLRI